MIKKYLEYVGLYKDEYDYKREKYVNSENLEVARKYLEYLEKVNLSQNSRQTTIEGKNSQIIGQSSLVISIVSLFIPLFADQLTSLNMAIHIALLIVFIALILHFILAIIHASKMLEIDKYRYMSGATSTITKDDRAKEELVFINEEIGDLVKMINFNNSVTNRIAANLVYAGRCFKLGIVIFFLLILCLLASFSRIKKEAQEINITNIKELKNKEMEIESLFVRSELFRLTKKIDSLNRVQQFKPAKSLIEEPKKKVLMPK